MSLLCILGIFCSCGAYFGVCVAQRLNRLSKLSKQPEPASSHLFAVQRVQPFDGAGVQLDGLRDVGEHLLEGVSRLLVQQDPHRLARLHAAADHRHQLGLDEVFALSALASLGAILGGGGGGGARRHPRGHRGGPARAGRARPGAGAWLPARDGDLGVVDLSERLVGGTDVALT